MLHTSITSPSCCYHIESFTELAPDQVGWVLAVGELYYGLSLMHLDDFKTTLLEG